MMMKGKRVDNKRLWFVILFAKRVFWVPHDLRWRDWQDENRDQLLALQPPLKQRKSKVSLGVVLVCNHADCLGGFVVGRNLDDDLWHTDCRGSDFEPNHFAPRGGCHFWWGNRWNKDNRYLDNCDAHLKYNHSVQILAVDLADGCG